MTVSWCQGRTREYIHNLYEGLLCFVATGDEDNISFTETKAKALNTVPNGNNSSHKGQSISINSKLVSYCNSDVFVAQGSKGWELER